jgi:hypothetical protein
LLTRVKKEKINKERGYGRRRRKGGETRRQRITSKTIRLGRTSKRRSQRIRPMPMENKNNYCKKS